MTTRDFIPFDLKCFSKLESRFEALFEPKLINEICQHGTLRFFEADNTWIKDYTESFSPDNNFVTTRNGDQATYDFLVVAPELH